MQRVGNVKADILSVKDGGGLREHSCVSSKHARGQEFQRQEVVSDEQRQGWEKQRQDMGLAGLDGALGR